MIKRFTESISFRAMLPIGHCIVSFKAFFKQYKYFEQEIRGIYQYLWRWIFKRSWVLSFSGLSCFSKYFLYTFLFTKLLRRSDSLIFESNFFYTAKRESFRLVTACGLNFYFKFINLGQPHTYLNRTFAHFQDVQTSGDGGPCK